MSGGESRRREFIPAIRDMIVKAIPGAPTAIEAAIDDWTAGLAPASPFDAGVFGVCEKIAADIDRQAAADSADPVEDPAIVEWRVTFIEEDSCVNQTLAVMWAENDRLGAGRKAEAHVADNWKGDWKILSIDRAQGGES